MNWLEWVAPGLRKLERKRQHHLASWDGRFLDLATHVSHWSKDPSTKVGAVIVRPDRTVASLGYNGLPRLVVDDEARLADRPTRLLMTVHAEMNAILSAHERLRGCTLYVSPFFPCANCAAAIIQAGIVRVVTWRGKAKEAEERWKAHGAAARQMFAEGLVEITEY